MTVLDYSAGFPGALNIVRAGHIGAIRYIGFPTRTKCTTRAELEDFTRKGLGMALVYEDTAGDWRLGFGRGRDAAIRARNHATTIGFPTDRPIYMAIDQDVATTAEFNQMADYLAGAAAVLGLPWTGVYGEHDVCLVAAQRGVATWFWQTRAWSGTPIKYFPGRHLYQRIGSEPVGGIDCDVNDVSKPDWGQHPMPRPVEEEEDTMKTIYAKGNDAPAVYCCSFDGEKAIRRYVEGHEFAFVLAAGWPVLTLPQADFDAIPKSAGSV